MTALRKTQFSVAHAVRHTGLFKAADSDDDQDLPNQLVATIDLSGLEDLALMAPQLQQAAMDAGMLIAADAGYESDMFNRLSPRAQAYARDRAAALVTQVTDTTRDQLRSIIADGLDNKLTRAQIADQIMDEDTSAFSPYRSDLIAGTEIRMANSNGALDSMKELRDLGVTIMKEWLPDAEACPICQANADQGPIDLDEDFDSGDDAPPGHPNCECTIISRITKQGEE